MPELPEVEIVRQSLNKNIKYKRVKKVIVRNRNLRIKLPNNFEKILEKKKIIKVSRFSKYIIINLAKDEFCVIHLGMSGTIHIIKNKNNSSLTNSSFYNSPLLPKKHNHVEIIFNKFKIIYNDPRRFGFFQIIKTTINLKRRFSHLGPEPFDKKFNLNYFEKFIKNKNIKIKDLLINQNFVSGVGNIYASEILFLSKIIPIKQIKLLNKKECNRIILWTKKVLISAIKKGGSSIRDFKNTEGNKGNFQESFKVYQREGLDCKRLGCKGTIIKKIITNRSTFFCNTCQN
jgi:formamidopyrimidine-DNA glycosylase